MTLLFLAFVAGLLTILAPCILPLIPVILGGSLHGVGENGGNRRGFTIVSALAVSLIIFTFVLKVSTVFISVPEQFWKTASGGIIIFFGLVYLFPLLWAHVPLVGKMFERSSATLGEGMRKKSTWGDIIVGGALGPVFATCSPTYFLVLATILPVNIFLGTVYIVAYTVGLCLSLFLIALLGARIVTKLGVAANPSGAFKRTLGLIFIIVGFAVLLGYDKKLERTIVDKEWFNIASIELKLLDRFTEAQKPTVNEPTPTQAKAELPVAPEDLSEVIALPEATPKIASVSVAVPAKEIPPQIPAMAKKITEVKRADENVLEKKRSMFTQAPEIVGASGYVNTGGVPVRLSDYVGKSVVLVEFWTYSCINCQHVLPYTAKWYKAYKDKGLVVVGVHTPEFAFEHVQKNVEDAAVRLGVEYPVVLDNDYTTWGAFQNRYWPRKYLIDVDGYIVYDHIGEGAYEETETKIQEALLERAVRIRDGV